MANKKNTPWETILDAILDDGGVCLWQVVGKKLNLNFNLECWLVAGDPILFQVYQDRPGFECWQPNPEMDVNKLIAELMPEVN